MRGEMGKNKEDEREREEGREQIRIRKKRVKR